MIAAKLDHMQEHSGVLRATNRTYDEWFALLDRWGASGRPISEIADWLEGEHGLSSWWAQKLITEYEQARALRPPGVRRGGTFTVGASKTVQVPSNASTTPSWIRRTERWLPGAAMRERTSRPLRSACVSTSDCPIRRQRRRPERSGVSA